MKELQFPVKIRSSGEIVLHRLLNAKTNITGLPVIIAHGTLSNSDAVRDLAIYLSDLGFDCWLFEWGGHGHSTPFSNKQDFEFPAFNDAP
ncbi:MAG: alpha/beta hydrolase [Saccharospirillaceae bacterium]|nr:alpha/beta hydrolase [Saccharospirillaceae bacterium]